MGSRKQAGERRPWEGGFVRWDARGAPTYWIARRYAGKRWCFSLHCHTLEAAVVSLRAWEADPWNFRVGGQAPVPVRFDQTLREAFLRWSEHEKHNSERWIANQRQVLDWWAEQLGDGVDLKRLRLAEDIIPALDKAKGGRHHRIAVLKALYGWLRKVRHVLLPAEDPTLGTLSAPPARPAQWKRERAFTLEQLEKVRAHLSGVYLSAADVQAGTGWHVTETIRFAESGSIVQQLDGKRVLVCPKAKSGTPRRTIVSEAVATAAAALREAGALSYFSYWRAMRDACEAAGLKAGTVSPGAFRHTVSTFAMEHGAEPGAVSAFIGHESEQTTKKFYATNAVPPKVPTPR